MATAINLLGFNDRGRSMAPEFLFFSETDFVYNYLHIVQKSTKKPMWEGAKKFTISFRDTSNPAIMRLQGV